MKTLKILGALLGALLLIAVGSFLYAKRAAAQRLDRDYAIEVATIPIPFPLTADEIAALRREKASTGGSAPTGPEAPAEEAPQKDDTPGDVPVANGDAKPAEATLPSDPSAPAEGEPTEQDSAAAPAADPLQDVNLEAIALERALARGKRYLESRAGCADCHGEDFGGKVIIDHPMMGTWVGPNITRGGLTKNYKPEDWVRIVRHGVKPDGKPATMPSVDFTWFSDQEISDIAAYITSLPAVERELPPTQLGPVFTFLVAFNENQISAELIDHAAPRLEYPPATSAATLELGKHLATTCVGCHGPEYAGGKVAGGDPSWPPAANLTFHETGLEKWTLADFTLALREGKRPDGRQLHEVMPIAYTKNFKDTEIEALYLYFQSVPKVPLKL